MTKTHELSFLVAQQARQPDGKVHVTAGALLQGFVQLVVREGHTLQLSQLSLALHQAEEVTNDVGDERKRKQVFMQHIMYSSEEVDGRLWKAGTYRFKFCFQVPQHLLATFSYSTEYGEEARRYFFLMTSYRSSHRDIADTEVVDSVVKVDLNKFQKSWKGHTTTEVVMHMFRKLPEVIQTAKETEGEAMKGAKSILRASTKVSCTVALANAAKKSYFMHYDSIPARIRISNPALTKIKEATAVLEQDVFHRLKTKSKGVHFVRMVLWECKLKIDPTQKDCIVPIDVKLHAKKLTPTVLRQMQTLIYVKHSIRVKLKLGKDLSDVTVRLPLVIMEPPVEHLAKALRKRYMEANEKGSGNKAEKIISSLSEEVTSLRQQQEEILMKLEQQQMTQQELLEQQLKMQEQPHFPPQQIEVDPSEDSAGYTESSASASASEELESRRVHAEQLGMPPERHQPMSTVVEDFEDGSCLVLASSEDYYRSLNA